MKTSKTVTEDPVCGIRVNEAKALPAERDGKIFYFCSDACRIKFLFAPAGVKPQETSAGC